jgi:hypothetical protein
MIPVVEILHSIVLEYTRVEYWSTQYSSIYRYLVVVKSWTYMHENIRGIHPKEHILVLTPRNTGTQTSIRRVRVDRFLSKPGVTKPKIKTESNRNLPNTRLIINRTNLYSFQQNASKHDSFSVGIHQERSHHVR